MNIRRILTIMLGIMAVVMTVSFTNLYAQQGGRGEFGGPGIMSGRHGSGMMGDGLGSGHLIRLAEQLNLTKEQRNSIFRIMDETRPKLRDNIFKYMDARKATHDLLKSKGKVDDNKLRSLSKEQGDAMGNVTYLRLKMRSAIRDVLTPEQLAKLEKFRGRRGMKADRDRRGWHGNGSRNWRQRLQQPQQQDNSQQG